MISLSASLPLLLGKWTPDLENGPRLARGGFGKENGVGKTWFCGGMDSKMEIRGFPVTQMDCMVPRRPLGKPVSPQTPLEKWFSRLFPVSGVLGEGPPGPLCISYGPFEGLAILSSYLVDPLLLYIPCDYLAQNTLPQWSVPVGHTSSQARISTISRMLTSW